VADLFTPEMAAQLLIIEHIDPTKFIRASEAGDTKALQELYNSVICVTGLNGEKTYSNNKSHAAAFGFAQFIKGTYDLMVSKYPDATLLGDWKEGMKHHVNAVKAQFLLFDSDLSKAPEKRQKLYFTEKFAHALALYLAAAYNCGQRRANRAIDKGKEKWRSKLPKEAQTYLDKLETVQDLQAGRLSTGN